MKSATLRLCALLFLLCVGLTSCGGNALKPGDIFGTTNDKIQTASMVAGAAYLRSAPGQVAAVSAIATRLQAAVEDGSIDAVDITTLAAEYLPATPEARILISALGNAFKLSLSAAAVEKVSAIASGLAFAAEIYGGPSGPSVPAAK